MALCKSYKIKFWKKFTLLTIYPQTRCSRGCFTFLINSFIHSVIKSSFHSECPRHGLSQSVIARELTFDRMFTPYHMAHATCHMSRVTSQGGFLFLQSGWAIWWRFSYQQVLTRVVLPNITLLEVTTGNYREYTRRTMKNKRCTSSRRYSPIVILLNLPTPIFNLSFCKLQNTNWQATAITSNLNCARSSNLSAPNYMLEK